MRQKQQAPDWPEIIRQLIASGLSERQVADQPGVALTLKGLRYLSAGRQTMWHRGEGLVQLWCVRLEKTRSEIPMADVLIGHRRAREMRNPAPRLQNLPAFPAPQQQVATPGRKRKAKESA